MFASKYKAKQVVCLKASELRVHLFERVLLLSFPSRYCFLLLPHQICLASALLILIFAKNPLLVISPQKKKKVRSCLSRPDAPPRRLSRPVVSPSPLLWTIFSIRLTSEENVAATTSTRQKHAMRRPSNRTLQSRAPCHTAHALPPRPPRLPRRTAAPTRRPPLSSL